MGPASVPICVSCTHQTVVVGAPDCGSHLPSWSGRTCWARLRGRDSHTSVDAFWLILGDVPLPVFSHSFLPWRGLPPPLDSAAVQFLYLSGESAWQCQQRGVHLLQFVQLERSVLVSTCQSPLPPPHLRQQELINGEAL